MVGEVRVRAGDGFATHQFFGLQGLPVGGEDELGTGFSGGGTDAQCLEGSTHGTSFAHGDMDVVALEHATRHIRSIVVASTQALECCVLIAKSGQKRERELLRVEWLKGQFRYGFFDFYCIHGASCLCDFPPLVSG